VALALAGLFLSHPTIAETDEEIRQRLKEEAERIIREKREREAAIPVVADSPLFGMKIAPQKSAILSNPIETEYGSINSPLSFRVNFCLLLIPFLMITDFQ
jgi:hypothetical protein